MKKYIMALDQGTTSSRAILFDHDGRTVSVAQKEFRQIYPNPGWVSHDASEIWECQLEVARKAIEEAGALPEDIAAIGITNQRETTVVWDRNTGEPVADAIVWQCRRTADMIEELVNAGLSEHVHRTTGLIPDAYFSASKIAWILDNTEGAREKAAAGDLLFGTIDCWLIWNLTGGRIHATDMTNASRTMLYDIERGCWDEKIRNYFDIPRSMLPAVLPSGAMYGETDESLFGGSIPVAGAVGDQQSALFGQCCFEPGDVKNTYGTGCFLLMNTGTEKTLSENGLLTTIAAGRDDTIRYALEGSVFQAGSAVQWLRDGIGLIGTAKESEALARAAEDTGGVFVVPAFSGLGAPHWDPYARGTIVGITRGTERKHIVRATLESIAYQTRDILKAMLEDSGVDISALRVDGGAARNDFLMQFQADILDVPVVRPANVEATALGAAYLAGLTVGFWKDEAELRSMQEDASRFEPAMQPAVRRQLLHDWDRAVKRSRDWAE